MTTEETIFSKIIRREIPATILYEDENILAFRDIYPQAPVHILIIPKKCISDLSKAGSMDNALMGDLLLVAHRLAVEEGIDKSGYRLVINNGKDAGQAVAHLHLHLIGGRAMEWPPG